MKKYLIGGAVLVLLIVFGALGIGYVLTTEPVTQSGASSTEQDATSTQPASLELLYDDVSIAVEVARTPAERTLGLSGRDALKEGTGMLFVFEQPERYAFWMPDMLISIDIIWLDGAMRVVHIKENAAPESYPERFVPNAPARYVLEVPAGFVAMHGVKVGDTFRMR